MSSRASLPGLLVFALLANPARPQSPNLAEQYLLAAANQERAVRDLAPLHLDSALIAAARSHAEQMAAHRDISHRFPAEPDLSERGSAAGAHFTRITENVAEGPSPILLHDAWMHSQGHRENLLDARVNAVGIAVIQRRGQFYAVQDFAHLTRTLSVSQQEATVALVLERSGLILLPETVEARAACSGAHTLTQPGYILRQTTDDLVTLPSRLLLRLAAQEFHEAAVGACPDRADRSDSNFSAYRLAILLYP